MNKYLLAIRPSSIIYLTILLLSSVSVFGQGNYDTTKYYNLLNNFYQYKWTFFTLSDTTHGVVVKHQKQKIGCGALATASLTIIKVDDDTIRVLDLCNFSDYSAGQRIKIIPDVEPQSQVHIPHYILISGRKVAGKNKPKLTKEQKREQRKITEKELSIWQSNEFDEKVLKTTWGQIEIEK